MKYLLRFRYSRFFRFLVLRGFTSKFMKNLPYLFLRFPLFVGVLLVVLFPTKLVSPKSEFPNSCYCVFNMRVFLLYILVLSSNTKFGKIERTFISPVFCVLVNNTSDNLMCAKYLQRLLDYMSRICNTKREKKCPGIFWEKYVGRIIRPLMGRIIRFGLDYPPQIFHQISGPLKID